MGSLFSFSCGKYPQFSSRGVVIMMNTKVRKIPICKKEKSTSLKQKSKKKKLIVSGRLPILASIALCIFFFFL